MVNHLFEEIGQSPEYIEFRIKVSIVEIYMEKIRDLLDMTRVNLKIREDKTRGVYIEDVTESYVSEEMEVYNMMKIGQTHRAISATNMNEGSSRSHSLFTLTVSQNNLSDLSVKNKITF
jgi:kinesin family member 5